MSAQTKKNNLKKRQLNSTLRKQLEEMEEKLKTVSQENTSLKMDNLIMQKRVEKLSAELEETKMIIAVKNSTLRLADVQIRQLEAVNEYNLDADPVLGGISRRAELDSAMEELGLERLHLVLYKCLISFLNVFLHSRIRTR